MTPIAIRRQCKEPYCEGSLEIKAAFLIAFVFMRYLSCRRSAQRKWTRVRYTNYRYILILLCSYLNLQMGAHGHGELQSFVCGSFCAHLVFGLF